MHESASPCHNVMVQWSLQSCKTWFKTEMLNTGSWASRIKHPRSCTYYLCAATSIWKTCYSYGGFIVLHMKPLFRWLQYPSSEKTFEYIIQLPLFGSVDLRGKDVIFTSFLFSCFEEKNLMLLMVSTSPIRLDSITLCWRTIKSSGLDTFQLRPMNCSAAPLPQLLKTERVLLKWTALLTFAFTT